MLSLLLDLFCNCKLRQKLLLYQQMFWGNLLIELYVHTECYHYSHKDKTEEILTSITLLLSVSLFPWDRVPLFLPQEQGMWKHLVPGLQTKDIIPISPSQH